MNPQPVRTSRGIAAAGHPETAAAAAELLRAGGNAFDAVLGAMCTACVAEPLLVSLGGGGFLLAEPAGGAPVVYDFFCQTPAQHRPSEELDFFPILADFGTDTQEFHIGMGSIAVPGLPAGLVSAHGELGRLPLREVVGPAIERARDGVSLNRFHRYIMRVLQAILRSDPAAFRLYRSPDEPDRFAEVGEVLRYPDLAEAFEALAAEGADLFYRGEWARRMAADSGERGGHLTREDLASYSVARRQPLQFGYRGAEVLINPPPSPGGCLIGLSLSLLSRRLPDDARWGTPVHAEALVRSMRAASLARASHGLVEELDRAEAEAMLGADALAEWERQVAGHALFRRGTTHISVADDQGNLASLTASNGEGSAYVLPGSGIMLNNMLGEQDLNPAGFGRWRPVTRLASMMSPAIVRHQGHRIALGSGGSNRIRSAVLQVIANRVGFGRTLEEAVAAPRMHLEDGKLSLEAGWDAAAVAQLRDLVPEVREWPDPNLFFGGVHAVETSPDGRFTGAADPRRGGETVIA